MSKTKNLNYGRIVGIFLLSYIVVTIAATAFSVAVAVILNAPSVPESEMVYSHAYVVSEWFLPLVNLIVWTSFALMYFKKKALVPRTSKQALTLSSFWLPMALMVDFVGFVLIKNPISLSPHDFYIGQFPWIYLIYVAVILSPFCAVALLNRSGKK